MLDIKTAFTVFDATSKGILLQEFSRPELWHAKELTETDKDELRQTENKICLSLSRIKGVVLTTLIESHDREQVNAIFGEENVDKWLKEATDAAREAVRPHGSLTSELMVPKI